MGGLDFGKRDRFIEQLEDALTGTSLFSSFAPTDDAPTVKEQRRQWGHIPAVYAITWMFDDPPSAYPEFIQMNSTITELRFMYVGRTGDMQRRFYEHHETLSALCGEVGIDLKGFWILALPVAQVWQTGSWEMLAIEYLRPPFNGTVKGLGSGGTGDFETYLRTRPDVLVRRLNQVLNDANAAPRRVPTERKVVLTKDQKAWLTEHDRTFASERLDWSDEPAAGTPALWDDDLQTLPEVDDGY